VRVGNDVKIATHLNRGSDVLRGHEDEIFPIEIDPSEITQAMFTMLETLIDGATPTHSPLLIAPKLS
jgi:hypothetical protein